MKSVNISKVYEILKKQNLHAPVAELIAVYTKDPEKILMSTILSARTKDEVTAAASKRLFSKVNKIHDLNRLSEKQIQELIYPVGFYKTKAYHLKQLPAILKEKFHGKIPETIPGLLQLPGVGRKTANLVLALAFHKPAICVDVHVNRIINRLGYVHTKTPLETEMALRKKLPMEYWEKINSLFVAFGQTICTPTSPHCSTCPIKQYCNKVGVKTSR